MRYKHSPKALSEIQQKCKYRWQLSSFLLEKQFFRWILHQLPLYKGLGNYCLSFNIQVIKNEKKTNLCFVCISKLPQVLTLVLYIIKFKLDNILFLNFNDFNLRKIVNTFFYIIFWYVAGAVAQVFRLQFIHVAYFLRGA